MIVESGIITVNGGHNFIMKLHSFVLLQSSACLYTLSKQTYNISYLGSTYTKSPTENM